MPSLRQIIADSRHSSYAARVNEWKFFSDSYEGGPSWGSKTNPLSVSVGSLSINGYGSDRYLTRFPLESSENYQSRVNRSTYVNVCSPAVDLYAATIGQPGNIHAELPSGWEPIWHDVDLQGSDYPSFMLAARTSAAVYGHCLILVDSKKASGEIRTQADVLAQGIRPFLRLIKPVDCLNWKLDADGNVTELLFRIATEPDGSILDGGKREPAFEYRYWSPAEWRVYREQGEEIVLAEEGQNPIGSVPAVALYHKRISPMQGESLLKDSARWSMLVSNWLSQVDSVSERQSFSQACLRSENAPGQVGVGSSVVLHLAPERKTADGDIVGESDFFYRSPETGPLELIWNGIDKGIRIANKAMGLQSEATEDKASPESGISRAWKWHDVERRLLSMATAEQTAANQLFRLLAAWQGQNEFAGSVVYSTKFDLSSVSDAIENCLQMQAAGIPPAARRELTRVALKKALPSLPADVQKVIDNELENMGIVEKAVKQIAGA